MSRIECTAADASKDIPKDATQQPQVLDSSDVDFDMTTGVDGHEDGVILVDSSDIDVPSTPYISFVSKVSHSVATRIDGCRIGEGH
jgi:hypothetical protein